MPGRVTLVLLLIAGFAGAHAPVNQGERAGEVKRLILSNEHTSGSFPLDSRVVEKAPAILRVAVSKVANPSKLPFQIFVYLSYRSKGASQDSGPKGRILIGNFGLYPPDHPGSFSVRASEAFRALQSKNADASEVRLLLEMRRIHESSPWNPVEVTIEPPEWRAK